MPKAKSFIVRGIFSGVAIVLASLPIAPLAFADMTPPDANGNSCFIVGSDQPGNHKPVGSDSSLFTYNCSTNLWQSSRYTFNPITNKRAPIDPIVYTYNSGSGKYDFQSWDFSAPLNDYVLTNHSTANPPSDGVIVGGPVAVAPSDTISNTGDGSTNTINNNGSQNGTNTINGTGNNSNNGINNDG